MDHPTWMLGTEVCLVHWRRSKHSWPLAHLPKPKTWYLIETALACNLAPRRLGLGDSRFKASKNYLISILPTRAQPWPCFGFKSGSCWRELTWNSLQSSCLSLLSAGITVLNCYICFHFSKSKSYPWMRKSIILHLNNLKKSCRTCCFNLGKDFSACLLP